jgi:hypothetical protein
MKQPLVILIFVLNGFVSFGQEEINSSILLKQAGIKICKEYSIDYSIDDQRFFDYSDSDTLNLNDRNLSFIQYYDSLGRIIKHIRCDYSYSTKRLQTIKYYNIEYKENKTFKTIIDSTDFKKVSIINEIDSQRKISCETFYKNDIFIYKNFKYLDSLGRVLKIDVFNEDNTKRISFNYLYKYDLIKNSEKIFYNDTLVEEIEFNSKDSKIITSFDKNENVTEKKYIDFYPDGREKRLCQILFNNEFNFTIVNFIYDSKLRLIKVEYPLSNSYEEYIYNDLGLLIRYIINNQINKTVYFYRYSK